MPLFRLNSDNKSELNILFLHIPKCGGSTIEGYFNQLNCQTFFKGEYKPLKGLIKAESQHFTYKVLEEILNIDDVDFIFSIVRNPFARLASEFRYRNGQIALVSEAKKMGFKNIIYKDPAEWVVNVLLSQMRYPHVLGNHLVPMHEYIGPEVKNIYYIEHGMNSIITDIEIQVGVSFSDQDCMRLNSTAIDPGQVTDEERIIRENFLSCNLVAKFYEKDFQLFYPNDKSLY